jgi:uncharacterized membrane protein
MGLDGDIAFLLLLGMFTGSAIQVPLRRVPCDRFLRRDPLAVVGLTGLLPRLEERDRYCLLALNVGGCLIPLAIVAWQVVRLASGAAFHPRLADSADPPGVSGVLIALGIATALNATVCWKLSRPVPGVGIALPGIVPVVLAASTSLLLAAEVASSVAFVSGTLGILIGTSLQVPSLRRRPIGLASIGGGGAFDGIVLNAVVSAFLG